MRASSHIASISSFWLSGCDGHSQSLSSAPLKLFWTRLSAAMRSANACAVRVRPIFQHTFQTWHLTPCARQAARHSFSASPRVVTSGETGSTFES